MAKNEQLFDAICAGQRQDVIDIVQGVVDDGGDWQVIGARWERTLE